MPRLVRRFFPLLRMKILHDIAGTVSTIRLLDPYTEKYQSVVNQFQTKWLHPNKGVPSIVRIFQIFPEASIVQRYEEYQAKIEQAHGPFQGVQMKNGRQMELGNEQRRFHGTSAKCAIGLAPNNTNFCPEQNCSICGIIRTSFKKSFARTRGGTRTSWERFGDGIYFSSTSSKSDDYGGGGLIYNGAVYKTMFLCKVVVGRVTKPPSDLSTLTEPPQGFSSVVGEPGVGNINYDEVVVYDDAACFPAYLIIYQP
ncbi:hypothetical protein BC937DRAFT_87263 [Endogone sp. FLAS-F59071]|nr:hypothetical protein BC937DRAFT_87263 [Endogone sp. FLAS-F59071]|eukprot:RUS19572.1 hypothetical protein BC937DRAFT_87263 [Endogone sp. FLAS-F59071]